jgi:hypothetical protein
MNPNLPPHSNPRPRRKPGGLSVIGWYLVAYAAVVVGVIWWWKS